MRQAVVALNNYLKIKPDIQEVRLLLAKAHAQRAELFDASNGALPAIAEYTQAIGIIGSISQSHPVFAKRA